MNTYWINILIWIIALPAGWLVGKLLKSTLIPILRKFSKKTENDFDDYLLDAFARIIVPLCWVIGVWVAYRTSNLFPGYKSEIRQGILVFNILIFCWAGSFLVSELLKMYLMSIGKVITNTSIFTNILKITIYIIGLIFIMNVLGIPIAPALTALGVGGLAVALALQDTLSNLFSGIQMLAAKKLKPGDYISLQSGEEGFVEDISWRNTTVRALGNHIIIVPNSTMANSIIKNYILPDSENSILIAVGVAYGSDLQKVEKITIEVGIFIQETVEGAVKSHIPFVRYNEFADSSINFNVILRSGDFTSQYLIKHEFIKALHERYNKEGIEIPFPIRTVYLKKETE